jgi:5-methylcytosine-specific restriction enzyme A
MPRRAVETRRSTASRETAAQRGYDRRWRKARAAYLATHPLCVACEKAGRVTAATVVDHVIRHEGQQDPLFWAVANWQALCKPHHDEKTRRESSGWQKRKP